MWAGDLSRHGKPIRRRTDRATEHESGARVGFRQALAGLWRAHAQHRCVSRTTRDPIMTMLSIAVEKLLKVAFGLLHIKDHRHWLPLHVLKNDYRHDLVRTEQLLRETIHDRADRATHRFYMDQALTVLESDPVWPPLIAALNRYGKDGRFYSLDALAENPQCSRPCPSLLIRSATQWCDFLIKYGGADGLLWVRLLGLEVKPVFWGMEATVRLHAGVRLPRERASLSEDGPFT